MNTNQNQLLVEMMDGVYPTLEGGVDGGWRSLSNNEPDALLTACMEVLSSQYATNNPEIIKKAAFDLLINGYKECAA